MYFYVCIYATQIMRTKSLQFYILNYQIFTGVHYNGYNVNKHHRVVYIY